MAGEADTREGVGASARAARARRRRVWSGASRLGELAAGNGELPRPRPRESGDALPLAPSRRERARRAALAAADVVSLLAAIAAASAALPLVQNPLELVLIVVAWLLLGELLGLRRWDAAVVDSATVHELPRLLQATLIAVGIVFLLAPGSGLGSHRHSGLLFVAVLLLALASTRSLVRMAVRVGFGAERALLLGTGEGAKLMIRKLATHPSYGVEIVGRVGSMDAGAPAEGPRCVGTLDELPRLCRELRAERLLVASAALPDDELCATIRTARALGLGLTIVPGFVEVVGRALTIDEVEGLTVLSLGASSTTRVSLALKRALDLVGSAAGLLVLSPLLAVIALAIKLDSPGPVFFSQTRIGRGGKPFRIHKFRTMVQGAAQMTAELAHLSEIEYPLLKIPEDRDPRLTRMGRILRKTMLDEAPQLWNVLRGQMSLVGPRPLEPQDDAEVRGWQRARLGLPPGITGPWQALGRHAIPFREMLMLDCLYVTDWTLWQDFRLLIRTAQVVFLRSRPL